MGFEGLKKRVTPWSLEQKLVLGILNLFSLNNSRSKEPFLFI
jgi:hypothetical protein